MAEQRSARNLPQIGDPIIVTLVELARVVARIERDAAERRRNLRLVGPGRRRDAA